MNKKGLFLSILSIFFSFFLNSQPFSSVFLENKPFHPLAKINQELIRQLETSSFYVGASNLEKDFIYWTNFARLYPKSFCDSVLIPFIIEQPTTKGDAANQLIKELRQTNPLSILVPDQTLSNTARDQARDLSKRKGQISHQSNNGNSFNQRMKLAGIKTCAAENISLGQNDQLVALLLLYLDIGLTDAGHRKNLMNQGFTRMGVSVIQMKGQNQFITVQDFGCPQQ